MYGNKVKVQWRQPGERLGGTAELTIAADGNSMTGTWKRDPKVYNSGKTGSNTWTFRRQVTATTTGSTKPAPTTPPTPGFGVLPATTTTPPATTTPAPKPATTPPVDTTTPAPKPPATTPTAAVDVTGEWVVEEGGAPPYAAQLKQQGTKVSGTSDQRKMILEGTVEGRTVKLRWKWTDVGTGGPTELTVAPDGNSMTGIMRFDSNNYVSRPWTYRRPVTATTTGSPKPDTTKPDTTTTTAAVDVTGEWVVEDGGKSYAAQLKQQGTKVSGTSDQGKATLEGTVDGRTAKLRWVWSNTRVGGTTELTVAPDGNSMTGIWTRDPAVYNSGQTGSGPWTYRRQDTAPTTAATTPPATKPDATKPDATTTAPTTTATKPDATTTAATETKPTAATETKPTATKPATTTTATTKPATTTPAITTTTTTTTAALTTAALTTPATKPAAPTTTAPTTAAPTKPSDGAMVVTLGLNQKVTDVNFGNVQGLAEISGLTWNDLNGDGRRDANEPVLPGFTVYLDLNANKTLDADEPSQVTDGEGRYRFQNLKPGTYVVRELLIEGFRQTFPKPGTSPATTAGNR